MTDAEARKHIEEMIKAQFPNVREAAEQFGVSWASLYKYLSGASPMPDWLLIWAGIKRVVSYEEA